MAVYGDFQLARYADGILAIEMQPNTPIGGWFIEFNVKKRFTSETPILTKSVASGHNSQSGIQITNSGAGILNVNFFGVEMSGQDLGAYAYTMERLTSGSRTMLSQGYLNLTT